MTHPALQRAVDYTLALLHIPSPTGYTKQAAQYVQQTLSAMGFPTQTTRQGAILSTLGGEGAPLLLCAHVDTLGAMVRAVKENGRLRFTRIGAYAHNCIENENCLVHTRDGRTYTGTFQLYTPSRHIYRNAVADTPRDNQTMEVLLDECVCNADMTRALGIQPGDFISIDPRTLLTPSGYLKSRHLDDKACAGILLALAEQVATHAVTLHRKIYLHFSIYEEVGHGLSSAIPDDVEEVLALDMGCVGDDLSCNEHKVSICAKDSCGPFHYDFVSRLASLALAHRLDYALDIYPSYGSDADAALLAGYDVIHGLIGPGIYASHGYERTHLDGISNTLWLTQYYIEQ
ncbi:MAG: M42 family metallopeptidase [Clostridia bacterium]